MAQHVQIVVKIGGQQVSPISYCSINQIIDWHHSFEILFPIDSFKKSNTILDQAKNFLGEKIEIAFKLSSREEKNTQNEFYGIITDVSLSRRNKGGKEVFLRGNSPTILMDGRPNCKAYADTSLEAIVNDLQSQISQNDLSVKCSPVYKKTIPYIVQYKESNYHFMNRIADKYGEWCFYNGQDLIFGKIDKSKVQKIPIDKNLTDLEFSIQIENINYKGISYDYYKNEKYEQITRDITVNDLDLYGNHALKCSEKTFKQEPVFYSSGLYQGDQEFTDYTENKKYALTKDLVIMSGSSDNPYINVGSVIEVIGESKNESDFGRFILTSLTHSIDITGNYVNHFTGIPAEANIESYNKNIGMPLAETQPALVTDNSDPDKMGRVKVKFYWQENGDESPWIRILNVHAGKAQKEQHGFYFIPEVDDEVMIGFENDNPDRPFVMGNVYHKNNLPEHWFDQDNNIKSIRTKSGNQIILYDAEGKEEIRILNPDDGDPTNEISLSLAEKGKITIMSQGDLEISAQNIKINADNDLTVESGQNTRYTSNDFSIDSKTGVNVKGQDLSLEGTNAALKATGNLDLEGNQTSLKATSLKMDANANAEISAAGSAKLSAGAAAELSGSATTIIKGGLVKIN